MKIVCAFLLIMLSVNIHMYAQKKDSDSAFAAITKILKPGKYVFSWLDVDVSPEIQKINTRFAYAVNANSKWFIEYSTEHEKEKPLPYHVNFGITKEEYDELQKYSSAKTKFKIIRKDFFEIYKVNNRVTFKGTEVFRFWDYVKIDLTKKQVVLNNIDLFYDKEVNTTIDNPVYWHGYYWKREFGDAEEMLKTRNTDYSVYELAIGKLKANSKIYLYLKANIFTKGQITNKALAFGYLDEIK